MKPPFSTRVMMLWVAGKIMPVILPLFDVGQVKGSVLVRADLRLMGRSWVDQHTGRMSHHGVHATERCGLGQLLLLQQNTEVQRQGASLVPSRSSLCVLSGLSFPCSPCSHCWT